MHASKVLLFLVAVCVGGRAAPAPWWDWLPWADDEKPTCEPWDEKGVENTWSILFYSKPNCEEEILRVDSKTQGYTNDTCYVVGGEPKSMEGVGHTKYTVHLFKDTQCKDHFDTLQYGVPKEHTEMNEEENPASFRIELSDDLGPFPRYAFCGLKSGSEVHHDTQRITTLSVCERVLERCGYSQTSYECPKVEDFYKEFRFAGTRCHIETYQMQAWFDELCEAEVPQDHPQEQYFCQRQITTWGDGSGPDKIDVPCGSPRPHDETK